jgi:predicted small metal-binding protein
MSELSQHQQDLVKSVGLANEFLKIVRGFKIDNDREDSLPQEIKEHLANEKLNEMIKEQGLEAEMLVWGLIHMIEILLKYADLTPEDLSEVMDRFIEHVKDNPENNEE